MANVSTTNNAALLKRWYTAKRVQEQTYKVSPFWAMVRKRTDFTGAALGVAIVTDGPVGGRSHTFATAQSNKSAGTEKQFLITRQRDYSLISIDNDAILASRDKKGSFLSLARMKMDQSLRNLVDNLSVSLYTNHGGARAQVGSTSTTTLTLSNTQHISRFAIGQVLDTSTTDGTSGSADGGGIAVTGIDRDAGTLTAASNWTGASNFSDNDYIFVDGDFGADFHGLDSWLPAAAPTSGDSHFGVDRSVDPVRLAGVRYNASALTLEEGLIEAETRAEGVNNGDPAVCLMHPTEVSKLKIELTGRQEFEAVSARDRADISFKALVVNGTRRPIKVIPDVHCPTAVAYMLDMDTWTFASLGPAPQFTNALGHQFQWDTSSDSLEMRAAVYGNLYCDAPGKNVRITLPS